jgi:hypothetical protein
MRRLLPTALPRGVRMVGNMGAANPVRGGEIVLEEAVRLGLDTVTVGVVTGDDVLDLVRSGHVDLQFWETGGGLDSLPGPVVSANAYLGADPMLDALERGADVVVTGRCSDLSPYVACLRHHYRWEADDWRLLAHGAVVGHLLECGRYVTGGAYHDPAYGKIVDRLDDLSLPLAEVEADGTFVLTKVEGTGGLVSVDTAKEQLLHEVHDPAAYLTPDVVADFRHVTLTPAGPDRVAVAGAEGRSRPGTLKALVGVDEGWIVEGEVSFAGRGAVDKAHAAAETMHRQLSRVGDHAFGQIRTDLIGLDSIHGPASPKPAEAPYEVRLRIAARTRHEEHARAGVDELMDLWFGPVGAGGVRTSTRRILAMYSTLVPRSELTVAVTLLSRQSREVPA